MIFMETLHQDAPPLEAEKRKVSTRIAMRRVRCDGVIFRRHQPRIS
jgi:hypothetical protein